MEGRVLVPEGVNGNLSELVAKVNSERVSGRVVRARGKHSTWSQGCEFPYSAVKGCAEDRKRLIHVDITGNTVMDRHSRPEWTPVSSSYFREIRYTVVQSSGLCPRESSQW